MPHHFKKGILMSEHRRFYNSVRAFQECLSMIKNREDDILLCNSYEELDNKSKKLIDLLIKTNQLT
jgi:hypothetical protein